jgi:thiamine biosynthesis protein ThiI
MNELILAKYGELMLKGLNRRRFEEQLLRDIRFRSLRHGGCDIEHAQSALTVTPKEGTDADGLFDELTRVFGLVGVGRAAVCEKNMDSIRKTAREYIPDYLEGKKTFKVESKRSDKSFPLKSPEISAEIGGVILEETAKRGQRIKVDVNNPDVVVRVEIRESHAFVSAGQQRGAGGMPAGSSGRGMVLLSGGIDSPVSAYMMARRGLALDAVHFESFPYTSEMAQRKVLELGRLLCAYLGRLRVHVISVTQIQQQLKANTDEDYFTLLLRRSMMRLAGRAAQRAGCRCLITGESLGQVASQTLEALTVTNDASPLPVFRPCIGMDKEEIITISRKIGTFDTSILPYEDCCTVFTPAHPKTRPELAKVLEQEALWNWQALEDEAMAGIVKYDLTADTVVEELCFE